MLAPAAAPATPNHTSMSSTTTPSSNRPSRLRGLSYLRSYTHDRFHSRSDAPPLTRSISSPNTATLAVSTDQRAVQIEAPSAAATTTTTTNEARTTTTLAAETSAAETPTVPTMARSRAATTSDSRPAVDTAGSTSKAEHHPTIRLIPHVEARSSRPSLHFSAISKTLQSSNGIIRVGRYTEREQSAASDEIYPVGFKSKVVSRRHCEFWCTDGQWFVKDVKSSSGTFLNHVRLSSPGIESRPYPVNDGDVVQLGIDFKGGEEVIFRCVKIRIECNRGWQKGLNNYNTTTHKKLLNSVAGKSKRDSDAASVSNHECSICLNPVTPCQCLFVAPCSHVWHYKCVRGLVNGPNWPNFLCPNCRFVADLEADVEPPEEDLYEDFGSEAGEEAGSVEIDHSGSSGSSDEAAAGASRGADVEASAVPAISVDNDDSSPPVSLPFHSSAIPTSSETTPARTQPVQIASQTPKHQSSLNDMQNVGSSTPGATAAFALAAGMLPDALLTPRNDAGPFVLDGSAGRVERMLNMEDFDDLISPLTREHNE